MIVNPPQQERKWNLYNPLKTWGRCSQVSQVSAFHPYIELNPAPLIFFIQEANPSHQASQQYEMRTKILLDSVTAQQASVQSG